MYPNKIHQRGSALVVAVFIIVVMLALVLALARLLTSSSQSVVYEVQGTKALFTAQSGLELALTELFPLVGTGSCSAKNYDFSTAPELTGCSAAVSCAELANALPDGGSVFRLTSVASCNSADFVTSRKVQIEVR